MDCTAHPARTRRDVDGVAGITTLEDDFVPSKQHGHGVGLDRNASIEVEHGVYRERSGHTGDRVDAPFL